MQVHCWTIEKNVINAHSRGIFIMFERLNSISDLKKINFGESVPKHSLILLYWFANAIDIDDWDLIRLTFDENSEDYGSHWYGNFEKLLDPLPSGYGYYTIGKLSQDQFRPLPNYVVNPPTEYAGDNRDRIIVRVQLQYRKQGAKTIDQVYITQHYPGHQVSSYDSRHTYRITPNLIRELQRFGGRANLSHLRQQFNSRASDSHISYINSQWPDNAGLGLLTFIVIKEKSMPTPKSDLPVELVIIIALLLLLGLFVSGIMFSK